MTFLPPALPLLPCLPPQVLFPHLQSTIKLSSSSLATVLNSVADNTRKNKAGESRVVAVVPVVEIERRVGRWATAAKIKGIEKAKEDDTFLLILEGLARIRLPPSLPPVLQILPPLPLTISSYSLPLPSLPTTTPPNLIPLAKKLLPQQLHSKLLSIPPEVLPDLLISILGVEWEVRVEVLGIADFGERCQRVREILVDILGERGIPSPDEDIRTTSPKSTALIRRPLSAPTQGPSRPENDQSQIPEDLQPLSKQFQKRLSKSEFTNSVQTTFHREMSRLNKIPPQSAEYNVVKSYLEWIVALPWKRVSQIGEVSMESARERLEEGHVGLESVKRRVVEYLAVYRLKKQLYEDSLRLKEQTQPHPKIEMIEQSTASDLLELIPDEDRRESESRLISSPNDQSDESEESGFRDKGPILLLVGPPGVGKTSIAKSLADCMGRKFHRISLGGVRDEAEIRGHRRTYVGALPGMIVQGLRKVGVSNPVILLDEIDKIGNSNFHGDPAAALLETLDPAQNWAFHDHYLGDLPIDMSQILFIATANTLDTISPPLLDRCEIIECSGYITDEKVKIGKKFLLPRQAIENGLSGMGAGVEMGDEVLLKVVTEYTREAGVRSLEREIGKLCRTKAVEYSAYRESERQTPKVLNSDIDSSHGITPSTSMSGQEITIDVKEVRVGRKDTIGYSPLVTLADVERILGIPKYDQEVREGSHRPGVVTGLAYQSSGQGGILLIESTLVRSGKGRLVLTGSLGDVIKESAEIGLTWVKAHAYALGITTKPDQDPLNGLDIHLHLPSGAIKKDGPSAGIAMVAALTSLLLDKPVPSNLAMTGEMTLRGSVTAVGGIKEKVLGAHRAGITKIILPSRNRKDVQGDLPPTLKEGIKFVFVDTIEQVLSEVWGGEVWAGGVGKSCSGSGREARL